MLDNLIVKCVNDNLQWFFDKHLKDHYNRRREALQEAAKRHEIQQELILSVDYVLKACIGPEAHYPPQAVSLWHEYYEKLGSGHSHVFQHLFVIYLKSDLASYLSTRERESKTGRQTRAKDRNELEYLQTTLDKLLILPDSLDFKSSVIKLSTGFWALDNDHTNTLLTNLCDPSIDFSNYFETTKDLVHLLVSTLYCFDNPRLALYVGRIHRNETWAEDYDELYARLLIQSSNLAEALKYERLFVDQENYQEILRTFIEVCSRLDLTRSLNRLNLSVEEENVLNEHLADSNSRVHSPASSSFILGMRSQQTRPTQTSTTLNPLNTSSGQNNTSRDSNSMPTPRNRNVQLLRKKSFQNDSPARNTRLAKKKKASETSVKKISTSFHNDSLG